eukprot:CAMPEP_0176271042 /NCGR_PEP_ID=MMETSP0121_2-20121125/45004_1 /TAXON_ID=160619 /ORGANISM="Kryptoperidinium foliaceum, Strain CCMP 1326" /LENGTH=372 /DNA_ID=CAMNT_0017611191 /DNA_START=55 /DNA_END=1173 /DNA_ORIENTATION=-
MSVDLVVVEYGDLCANADLSLELLRAWGENGLGIIAVRGIPGWVDTYTDVLRQAHPLAHLSEGSLKALEDEESMYNAGWSHGKEKLGDKPDFAKGSFYFNPVSDAPGTEEDRKQFPWAMPKNRWPAELPEMPLACKRLGATMRDVVAHLARHVDSCMERTVEGYRAQLGALVSDTQKCKGRLLYYFPPAAAESSPSKKQRQDTEKVLEDGWIGWHNDSGFFTALSPDLYVDDGTGEVIDNPDPEAGLWVVARSGCSVRVSIPRDCMCVQVGECVQVVTGGVLVATPHCVRGCRPSLTRGRRVARVSCPCFIDTHPSFPLAMPAGGQRDAVLARGLSSKVPPLGERWTHDGQTFGDFLGASFRRYYEWAAKAQ